jgi:hypothetical protein
VQTLDQLAENPEAVVGNLRARYIERINRAELADGEEDSRALGDLYDEIEALLINVERRYFWAIAKRRADRRSAPPYRKGAGSL